MELPFAHLKEDSILNLETRYKHEDVRISATKVKQQ